MVVTEPLVDAVRVVHVAPSSVLCSTRYPLIAGMFAPFDVVVGAVHERVDCALAVAV